MTTIWKYTLQIDDGEMIDMPRGARPLAVQVQAGDMCLWAAVDSRAPLVRHKFNIGGTGHPLPDGEYIGSVQDGPYVWHIFDGGEV